MDKKGKTITGVVVGVVAVVALVLGLTFGLRSCDNEDEEDLVTETEGVNGSSSTDDTTNSSTSGSGSSSTDTTNSSTSGSGSSSTDGTTNSSTSSSGSSSSSSSEASHTHSYITKYTSEGHYQECTSCGETTSLVPHDLVYTDNANGLALHDTFASTGSHHVQCSLCDYNYDEAHDYCEDHWMSDGTSHWHECEECHSTEASSISTHSFSNFTDDHDGQHHHEECSICHYGCDEDHNFDLDNGVVIVAATCTGQGLTTFTCLDCGAVEDVETPALGHLYSETDYESNEYGHYQKCLRCEEYSIATHTYDPTITYDDTNHYQTCLVCGYVSTNSHQWDEGYVELAATCTSDGLMLYHCTTCSATSEVTIEALGHDPLKSYSSDASGHWYACTRCNEKLDFTEHTNVWKGDSDTHYEECSICSYKSTEEYHSWDEGVETTSPTCEETGIMTYTCKSCGATKEGDIEPLGHNYDTTYTADAYGHYYKCLNEGCTSRADYEEHNLSGYSYDSDAHYQVCPICSYIALEEDHDWDNGEEITPATCTDDGVMTYTCYTCGATKDATISALGHTNETTYTSNGSSTHTKTVTCSVCGNTTTTTEDHTTTSSSTTSNCVKTTTTKCTYCSYSTSSSTTSHSGSTTTSYTNNGSSGHTVTVKCSTCGTTLSTSTASHTTTTSTSTSKCTTTTTTKCKYCSYSTSSESTAHQSITETYTYTCKVSVGATASTPTHTQKVVVTCSTCGTTIYTTSSTQNCTLFYGGYITYICSDCGAIFLKESGATSYTRNS